MGSLLTAGPRPLLIIAVASLVALLLAALTATLILR
jgi:hypothetical protein